AALGAVARARGRAADPRALQVRRTQGARPRTALGRVTDAGRRAADRGRRLERVGRAVVAGAVAALGDVARARRRAAGRRALRVAGTEGARAAARFRGIANTGRGTALDPGGHQGIGRAGIGESVAQLGDVAGPDGRAADAAALHVRRAEGGDAGARLGWVAGAA